MAVFVLTAALAAPLSGCMTMQQAYHFPDGHQYVRTFDADPAATLAAVEKGLAKMHRLPVEESVPGGAGGVTGPELPGYYAWIFTDQKVHYWLVTTTSNTLNIFLKQRSENQTDVIITYMHSKAIWPFYDYCYYNYRNDRYVDRVFDAISRSFHSEK
ncbi:MAG: hypothetical protein ACM3OC_04725 [Deltaproteobacteria bacterium]